MARDVRVFHIGNCPPSRSFLIYLGHSKLDPFTDALPQTTLGLPSPVTRVVRLALKVLLRPPTPASASLPTSLALIGSLTRLAPGRMQVSWGHARIFRIVPPANTLVRWVNEKRLRPHSAGSTLPHLWPTCSSSGWPPLTTARYFSSCPSDSGSLRTPCPPGNSEQLAPGPPWPCPAFAFVPV